MLFRVSLDAPTSTKRSRSALTAAVLALVGAASLALPAHAGLFDDEEARQQIIVLRGQLGEVQRALDARLSELEAQARNRSIIDLFNQVETLRAEFARLRGALELLQNELEVAQKRQRDLYVDLDGRMRKLEAAAVEQARTAAQAVSATAAATPAPAVNLAGDASRSAPPAVINQSTPSIALPTVAAPTPPIIDPAQEQRAYDQGLEHFRSGRFGEAVTQFQLFIRNFPRSNQVSSAQYWIGNSLYATRDFRGAIAAQRQLLSQYPDSNKAPDALLNIATSQAELGDLQGARATLQEVNARYPSSEAAAKARQRLGIR
ncbi:MAG: tol-pal system protein YbgF [Betaproteobacteria bacterium]|nr:MAG: tol-pal system protein YbgF [Betaproteobacteria bacterium]